MGVSAIDIGASGMRAQRLRMELIANNLANADNTNASQREVTDSQGIRYTDYAPYRRKVALFQAGGLDKGEKGFGVTTPQVVDDPTDFRTEYDPGHPHSVKNPEDKDFGRVRLPNVNPIVEMVDMIAASRAYEANVTAVDTLKGMEAATLRILA